MKDWVNKKDKYGYTYEQIHRPGYAYPDLETYKEAYEPINEEASEEALELVKLREPGGYEDPLGGDIEDVVEEDMGAKDIEVEDIFGAKELEESEAPAPKDPVVQAASVMSLFSKAKRIKVPKSGANKEKLIEEKSHAYADVIEALRAFEGEAPASLKKLEKRFKTGKLKPYSKFLDQGRSWIPKKRAVRREAPSAPGQPQVTPIQTQVTPVQPQVTPIQTQATPSAATDWNNVTPYDKDSILKNADNVKDGFRLREGVPRPELMIDDDVYTLTSNHMEPGHGRKPAALVLVGGEVVRQPEGRYNYGWDLINNDLKIKSFLGGEIVRIDEQDRSGKYPTGYGRLVEVKTDKMITVDGKQYPLYIHYAHATPDSFLNIEVGERLEVGQEIGKIGGTGRWATEGDTFSPHLDVRGYIWVDGKRVHISPSEFMPLGPEEARTRKGYLEGGAVNAVPMDSWRTPRPRPEDVDQDIYERESQEVEFETTDNLSEMDVEELGEWRDRNRHRLSNDRVNAVNELISIKIQQGEKAANPPTPVYDRPTGADDPTPLPVRFETRSQTTYPGEEPGPWSKPKPVEDPPRAENMAKYKPFPIKELTRPSAPKAPPAVVVTPEQQKLKQDIDAEKANQARLREHQAAYDIEFKKYMSEQFQLTKLDPNRFWKSQGTVSKIFAILGSAAGAYGAGRWGGPNIFKKQIDDAINKDILSQKLDREDQIKRRSAAWKRVELMAGRLKNTIGTQEGQQRLNILENTFKLKHQKLDKEKTKEKQKELDLIILRGPMTREQADRLNLQYPKLKINDRSIVGRSGKIWLARSYKEAQRLLKEVLPEATKALNAGERIRELIKEVGFLDQINPFSSRVAEASTLREVIKGAIRLEIFGPGVMTDTERRIAEKIIANPSAILTTDAKEVAKINTLMSKMRYGLGQRLRRAGLYLPPSQNEESINQLLRIRKQRNTDRNRAQAVHDLVILQEKYDKTGFTEKVAWIYNEPLPI